MKKILFVALFLASFTGFAQLSEHALGLRLGDNDGFGTEISYQRLLGSANRLELDLGFRNNDFADAFKLTGIYQWVKPLGNDGFYWYVGVGGGLGFVDYNFRRNNDDNDVFITLDGMLGVEYSFQSAGVPLQLSLDFNPEFGILNSYGDDFDFDLALGIRYQF
jgi:hypothetical protein